MQTSTHEPVPSHAAQSNWSGRAGFTLAETMVASALTLLLVLTIFETARFSARAAYDIKSRLAADALAFDTVWDLYNRQISWLSENATESRSGWVGIDPERNTTWGARGDQVFIYWEIEPDPADFPPKRWTLKSNVQWPSYSGGGVQTLPRNYQVRRERTNRKLFSTGN
ncbi:MAG: hypothetical protein PHW08_10300 [Kiritimatiellae bacterium]|jgi:hypothetical protein|nr:hypothetical protein [Kiritimatiellia bacterium]